ncbi:MULTISPECIES: hypothetical protein [unclassified Streptomyces]|uniref:hypothetical protein n=1 Tax=unclassified Streptomyces TaxID=2593676 RepID=UPI001CBC7882|nr:MULTISPECIES: hypothetical protein [unclassified Streptomyces]WPO71854.1 hypothetical protein R9806_15070 [Streptomyces sp. KN37]
MLKITALPGVPRWAALAAHAVPWITLPSGLWRVALVAGLPVAAQEQRGTGEAVYVLMLSLVSEALALLTLGLVREWGETVPGWVPVLGGRQVPTMAAVAPALLGAAGLFGLLGWAIYAQIAGLGSESGVTDGTAQTALIVLCYIPLIAWPPLLTAVALAYYRRRTACASPEAA